MRFEGGDVFALATKVNEVWGVRGVIMELLSAKLFCISHFYCKFAAGNFFKSL
jgi:hypothetical protein